MPSDEKPEFFSQMRSVSIRPAGDQGPVSGVDLPHVAGPHAEMFRLDIDTPFGWTSLVNSFAISWQRRSWLVKRFEGKRTIRVSFGLAWKSR